MLLGTRWSHIAKVDWTTFSLKSQKSKTIDTVSCSKVDTKLVYIWSNLLELTHVIHLKFTKKLMLFELTYVIYHTCPREIVPMGGHPLGLIKYIQGIS